MTEVMLLLCKGQLQLKPLVSFRWVEDTSKKLLSRTICGITPIPQNNAFTMCACQITLNRILRRARRFSIHKFRTTTTSNSYSVFISNYHSFQFIMSCMASLGFFLFNIVKSYQQTSPTPCSRDLQRQPTSNQMYLCNHGCLLDSLYCARNIY